MAYYENLVINNAQLLRGGFKNFSGTARPPYTPAGKRSFHVVLSPSVAEKLRNDGWNVKTLTSRDEDEEDLFYIKVSIGFSAGSEPPFVVLKTDKKTVKLNEKTIGQLDSAEIKQANIVIRPYDLSKYSLSGPTRVTGYLKSMEVTIEEDDIQSRYGDLEDELPFDEE